MQAKDVVLGSRTHPCRPLMLHCNMRPLMIGIVVNPHHGTSSSGAKAFYRVATSSPEVRGPLQV